MKRQIVEKMLERLQEELLSVNRAARAAHEAATHAENKPENQYDTRGLEASYLAGAQAQRAAEIQALISVFRLMPIPDFVPGDAIAPGALVAVKAEQPPGRKSHYLIVPRVGGAPVTVDGTTVQPVVPQSPMGEALIGRKAGDWIEVETKGAVREYRIVSVS